MTFFIKDLMRLFILVRKKESFLDSCLVELKNSVTNSVMTVKKGLKRKEKMNRTASQPERNFRGEKLWHSGRTANFLDYLDTNFLGWRVLKTFADINPRGWPVLKNSSSVNFVDDQFSRC